MDVWWDNHIDFWRCLLADGRSSGCCHWGVIIGIDGFILETVQVQRVGDVTTEQEFCGWHDNFLWRAFIGKIKLGCHYRRFLVLLLHIGLVVLLNVFQVLVGGLVIVVFRSIFIPDFLLLLDEILWRSKGNTCPAAVATTSCGLF